MSKTKRRFADELEADRVQFIKDIAELTSQLEASDQRIKELEDELKMFAQTPVGQIFQKNKELEAQLAAVRVRYKAASGLALSWGNYANRKHLEIEIDSILAEAAIGEGE